MMELRVSQLNDYFADKLAECSDRKSALLADDRKDEACFWQIRANIYGIFKTIFSVAERTQKSEAGVKTFFTKQLSEMTNTWAESGRKASDHGDVQKAAIEQIKVETAGEIRRVFEEIWGENNDGN